jgi:hypothetical protein
MDDGDGRRLEVGGVDDDEVAVSRWVSQTTLSTQPASSSESDSEAANTGSPAARTRPTS